MRLSGLFVVLLVASACSIVNNTSDHMGGVRPDGAMPPDGGGGPISAADLCSELTSIVCHARTECCPDPTGPSFEECRTEIVQQCARIWGALAVDPRTGFDPNEAGQVLGRGRDLANECHLDYFDWVAFETFDMFTGTVPPRGACAIPREDELATIFQCTNGNICRNQRVLDFECAARSGAAGPCASNFDCRNEFYCDAAGDVRMGECQPRKADGATCNPDADECQSLACTVAGTCIGRFDQFFCFNIFEDV